MAKPLPFEVFLREGDDGSRSRRMAARTLASAVLATAIVLLCVVVGQSNEKEPRVEAQSRLFEMPDISLGIREHEALGQPQQPPALAAAPAPAQPATATSSLAEGDAQGKDLTSLDNQLQKRWNYGVNKELTWPPHNTDTIPTGAYAINYKGPYDPDYDWPDDTEVMRNDEWDKSGGVGCGMSGNNC